MKKIEKSDWCIEGLKVLEKDGFQKITIDHLCTLLKKTKGAFYHHFQNIDGYVETLMKYWTKKCTMDFIEDAERITDANEKLLRLNHLASSASHRSEQVIRAWSFSNRLVRKYLQQVDNIRMEYLIKLNIERGSSEEEANKFAIIEYGTLIGIQQLQPDISEEKFRDLYLMFLNKVATTN